MKYKNGKWNKVLMFGIMIYIVMLLDIIINTAIAHISNDGVSRITNAIMIGPVVFNPISVLPTFALGTVLILIGLILKKRDYV